MERISLQLFDLDKEQDILDQAKDNRGVMEILIEIAEPYLAKMVMNFSSDRDKIEEYLQEAELAFLKSVKGYDKNKGKFTTYMITAVRHELFKFIYQKDGDMRIDYYVPKGKRKK